MAADLSEFDELNDRRCSVGKLLAGLTAEERALYEKAEAIEKYDTQTLFRWLRTRSLIDSNSRQVGPHRARKCGCYRG